LEIGITSRVQRSSRRLFLSEKTVPIFLPPGITTSLYTSTQRDHRILQTVPVANRGTIVSPMRKIMPVASRVTPPPLLLSHITQFRSFENAKKQQAGRGFERHGSSLTTASTMGRWQVSAVWRLHTDGAGRRAANTKPIARVTLPAYDDTTPQSRTDGSWKSRKAKAVIATEMSYSTVANVHSSSTSSRRSQVPHGVQSITAIPIPRNTQLFVPMTSQFGPQFVAYSTASLNTVAVLYPATRHGHGTRSSHATDKPDNVSKHSRTGLHQLPAPGGRHGESLRKMPNLDKLTTKLSTLVTTTASVALHVGQGRGFGNRHHQPRSTFKSQAVPVGKTVPIFLPPGITTSLYTSTQRDHRILQTVPVANRGTIVSPMRKIMPVASRVTPPPLLLSHITQFRSFENAKKQQAGRGFERHGSSLTTASTMGRWQVSAVWRLHTDGAGRRAANTKPIARVTLPAYNDTTPQSRTDGSWKSRKAKAVIATEMSYSTVANVHSSSTFKPSFAGTTWSSIHYRHPNSPEYATVCANDFAVWTSVCCIFDRQLEHCGCVVSCDTPRPRYPFLACN